MVGQLYGGFASCSSVTADYYGRFSQSYSQLQTWLGNCGQQLFGYPSSVGVDERVSDNRIGLFPNPTNGRVTVTLPLSARTGAQIIVYDALGQQLISRALVSGLERVDLDLSGRSEGIYLVELVAGTERQVERLILND